jgi:hypothetical protein
LNARVAVISAQESTLKSAKFLDTELTSFVDIDGIWDVLNSTKQGFPLTELKLISSYAYDISLIKQLTEAMSKGRPQYFMGKFSIKNVDYETLLGVLKTATKVKARSDRLDRLMFYADLCVRLRTALLMNHWEVVHISNAANASVLTCAEEAYTVKQGLDDFRSAGKFFTSFIEGVPPAELAEEFLLVDREYECRLILQNFSVVLQSGAISGSPFNLKLRQIKVSSLEAQIARVGKWEKASGIFDVDMQTYCKTCRELLEIRTQVRQIQRSYERKSSFMISSNSIEEILTETNYLDDAIASALDNVSRLSDIQASPMVSEWEPVGKLMSLVQAAKQRSSRREVDLVYYETFTRSFVAKVVSVSLGWKVFLVKIGLHFLLSGRVANRR